MVLPVINGTPIPTPPRSSQSNRTRSNLASRQSQVVVQHNRASSTRGSTRGGASSGGDGGNGSASIRSSSSSSSRSSKFSVAALDAIESMKQQIEQQQQQQQASTPPVTGQVVSPPKLPQTTTNTTTTIAGGDTGKKFTLKEKETVAIKPAPELKFAKVGGQVQERDQETEADLLRKNYNKRAPWDKTPLWRPMSRSGAQMLLDIKQQQQEENQQPSSPSPTKADPNLVAPSSTSFRQHVSPTNANGLPTHISPTKDGRQLGSTQAVKLITPAQRLAVEFSQRQSEKVKGPSLSPGRGGGEENLGSSLSPAGSGGDYGLSPSGSITSPVRAYDTSRLGDEMLLNCLATSDGSLLTEDEQELRIEEALEHKNSASHRPAGRNLLATLKCGETLLAPSTRKRQERSKQFDWHRGLVPLDQEGIGTQGTTITETSTSTTTSVSPSRSSALAASVRGLMFSPSTAVYGRTPQQHSTTSPTEVNNNPLSKSYSGGKSTSANINNDNDNVNNDDGFIFNKNNELDRMSWNLYRRAEKRKAQIAAKIAGGTVVPQGPDSQGVPLNFIRTHRRLHEAE